MTLLAQSWCRQCFEFTPTEVEALAKHGPRKPQFFSPCSNGLGLTVVCQKAITSGISILLKSRRPSTIAGLVSAIVVDALKGVTFRASSQRCEEQRVVSGPFRAHLDAALFVIANTLRVLPFTSALGVGPCPVLACVLPASAFSVRNWHA